MPEYRFSLIRILYGKIRVSENLYYGTFYAVRFPPKPTYEKTKTIKYYLRLIFLRSSEKYVQLKILVKFF